MFENFRDIITVDELCEMLRIGKSKAYHLLRNGKIKAFREDRLWVISKQSVIDYIMKFK